MAYGEGSGRPSGSLPVIMKPFVIERQAPVQPLGIRIGAQHEKDIANRPGLDAARHAIGPGDLLQSVIAAQRGDLRLRHER